MRSVKGSLEKRVVNGHDVWIAESHHMVLEAWAIYRKTRPQAPDLITLDYHTDLRIAFVSEFIRINEPRFPEPEEYPLYAEQETKNFAMHDVALVRDAIRRLTYEEHIDAAQRSGIIDAAFLLLSNMPGIEPDALRNQYCVWRDGSKRKIADAALESVTLHRLVDLFESTKRRPIVDADYILDIDLDYLRTEKSSNPCDPRLFHQLIRGAGIITIALEPECVKYGRLAREKITADSLLEIIIGHIVRA